MENKYEINTDRSLVKESVKAILSLILFHRLFGPITPQVRQIVGISYPHVVDSRLDDLLEEKTSRLLSSMEQSKAGRIGLQFYEHQKTKKQSWFVKAPDQVWERWIIDINVHDRPPRNQQEKEASEQFTEKQLRNIFLDIIKFVNENKTHIPPITTTDSTPFRYLIAIPGEDDIEGWGATIMKILGDQ